MKKHLLQFTAGAALLGFAIFIQAQSGLAAITINAVPTVSSGSNGVCPGSYAGYVSYTKTTAEGWGWAPTNTVHTATDTNRTDTKVVFEGKSGDSGCNQTTVTVPHPTTSSKYRFYVYFTNNVPTNSYPLVLEGFSP